MAVLIIFAKYDVADFFVNKICDRKLNKNASTAKNDTKEWACYYSKNVLHTMITDDMNVST